MKEQIDAITEPHEWIDTLIVEYAPNSHDIDVALQNMGLKIKRMQEALDDVKKWDINQAMNHGLGVRYTLPEWIRKKIQAALEATN